MSSVTIEDLGLISKTGLYSDFGSDREDEDWERKQIEKEYEEIRDFVKCHPMSLPDDEDGDAFWHKVIDRMKEKDLFIREV